MEDSKLGTGSTKTSRLRRYEGVGRLIAKSIYDDVRLPIRFNPTVFKFLAGLETADFRDYEAYDPSAARNLRRIEEANDEYLEAVSLDFEDLPRPEGGHPPRSVCSQVPSSGQVTRATASLYCRAFVE